MTIRTEATIREAILAHLIARTRLNDVRGGGTLAQIAGAVARELFRAQVSVLENRNACFLTTSEGDDLRRRLREVLPDGYPVPEGTRAVGGAVRFTRRAGSGITSVPANITIDRSSDDFRYVTLSAAPFAGGNDVSNAVSVAALAAGASGNCSAGEINRITPPISGVIAVTNSAAVAGGTDGPTDESLREDARTYVRALARGTESAVLSAALRADDPQLGRALFARLHDPGNGGEVFLFVDNGSPTGCGDTQSTGGWEVLIQQAAGGEEVFFLAHAPVVTPPTTVRLNGVTESADFGVDAAWGRIVCGETLVAAIQAGDLVEASSYSYEAGLPSAIQRIVDGLMSDPVSLPGFRAAGTKIRCRAAAPSLTTIQFGIIWTDRTDILSATATLRNLAVRYVNSLGIGKHLLQSELVTLAQGMPQVYDVRSVLIDGEDRPGKYAGLGTAIRTDYSKVTMI